jgi:nucleotide-binding universal stress UspA family protein
MVSVQEVIQTGESIVVGTDGSESAKRALGEAVRLAQALKADVHIVSAYEPLRGAHIVGAPEGAAKVWAPLPDSQVEGTLGEAAAFVRMRNVPVETHAVRKDPAAALLEVAGSVGASLIVVGSRGMHGAKRFVLGSVPNTVSHNAHCNVLIVSTDRD